MATAAWEIGLVVLSTFFNASGPIFLKQGINRAKSALQMINSMTLLGLGCFGFSFVISIPAFKGGEVSVLYPFVALTYVWVSFFSIKYLGEHMNMIKWAGIALIILGVSFIGFSA